MVGKVSIHDDDVISGGVLYTVYVCRTCQVQQMVLSRDIKLKHTVENISRKNAERQQLGVTDVETEAEKINQNNARLRIITAKKKMIFYVFL